MAKKGFGFKPKENGGVIRGPGTGTSDSIATEMQPGTYIMPADSTRTIGDEALKKMADAKVPVRVSNGEFEFTPEQVQSIGAAVLTALRDATHKPVDKPNKDKPVQAFAGGGGVDFGLAREYETGLNALRSRLRFERDAQNLMFSEGAGGGGGFLETPEPKLEFQQNKDGPFATLANKSAYPWAKYGATFDAGLHYANGGTIQPRGFQPAQNGGLIKRAMGLFSSRQRQIDDVVDKAMGGGQEKPKQQPHPEPQPEPRNPKFEKERVTANNAAGISFADGGQVEIEQDGSPVHIGSLSPLDSKQIVGRTQTAGPGKKEYNEQYGFGPGTGRGAAPFDFRTGKKNEGYRHGFKGNPSSARGFASGGMVKDEEVVDPQAVALQERYARPGQPQAPAAKRPSGGGGMGVRDDNLAASGMMSNDGTFIPEYQGGKNRMDMYGSTMRGNWGLANGGPVPARGFQPQRFSKGGKVEEEEPGIYPYNHPAAGANVYDGTASGMRDIAGSVVNTLANAFPGTTAALKGSVQDAREAYQQGGLGAAVGQSARVAVTPLIGLADDVYRSAARVTAPAEQALKTAFTGDATPINKPPAKPDADKSSPPARTPQYATLASVEGTQNRNQAPQAKGFDPEQAAQHFDRTKMTNAQVAEANPEGRVKVTKSANGTTEFSGNNVRGAVSYTDANGKPLPGGGVNGKGFATFEVAPAGSNVVTGPNGSYAYATSGSGTRTPEKVQQDIAQSKLQTADRAKQLGVDVNGMTTAQAEQYMAQVQAARENARSAQAIAGGSKGAWENFNDMRSHENIAYRNAGVTAKSLLSGGKNFGGNNSAAVNSALNAQKAIIDSVAKRAAGEPSLAENQRQFDAQQGLAVRQQDAGERSAEMAGREQARQTQRKEGMEDKTFATASENARLELAAAQRKAAAFDAYAKATPEARAQVAAQFPDLFGGNQDKWQGIALQGGMDANGNKTESVLAAVNQRTGEMRRLGGEQNKPLPAPKDVANREIGPTYISPNGKLVKWTGEGWIPA